MKIVRLVATCQRSRATSRTWIRKRSGNRVGIGRRVRLCATMRGMSERPEQPPEGRLIAAAQKRTRLSNRKAADRAGLSEGHWRAIVSGSRSVATGVWVPVHAPARTLARMAQVVGVTPEQLVGVDREDAADELREMPQGGAQKPTVEELEERVAELEREIAEWRAERRREQEQHRDTG